MFGYKKKLESVSDLDLVKNYKLSGNNVFIQEIFDRHCRRMLHIALKLLRDVGLAEDAVQSTFEKAYREIKRFNEEQNGSNLEHWLSRICRNICLDELRKHKSRSLESFADGHDGFRFSPNAGERVLVREVFDVLANLDEPYRICLLLKIEGYSYQEIVSRTGYTFDEVKTFIRTARRHLIKSFKSD